MTNLLLEREAFPVGNLDPVFVGHIEAPGSRTFEYLHATPGELEEATRAIDEIRQDPVVAGLREPLEVIYDEVTLAHSDRVAVAAYIIGMRIGLSDEDLRLLGESSAVHDIGKADPEIQSIVQSDEIFEGEELQRFLEKMEKHPQLAADKVFQTMGWDEEHKRFVADIVGSHHAFKSRNPYGPQAQYKIMLAKVLAMADTLDALASERSYKRAFSEQTASVILAEDFAKDPYLLKVGLKPRELEFFYPRQRFVHLPPQAILQ